jgi:hypothetical protein
MTLDAAILAVVVAFLLALRLLSLALRLATSGRGFNAQGLRRSCATLALTAALFAAIFALPRDRARECAAPAVVANGVSDEGAVQYELRAEVGQLKLQLAWLGTSEVSCYLVLLCPFRANPVSVHSVIDSVSEFYVSG